MRDVTNNGSAGDQNSIGAREEGGERPLARAPTVFLLSFSLLIACPWGLSVVVANANVRHVNTSLNKFVNAFINGLWKKL